MSSMAVTIGEIIGATTSAYGAYMDERNTVSDTAVFVTTMTSVGSTIASFFSSQTMRPYLSGLTTGVSAGSGAALIGFGINALNEAKTPADGLSAALNIIGGVAGVLSTFAPPGPAKVAFTAISAAAGVAELAVKQNKDNVNSLINDLNTQWHSAMHYISNLSVGFGSNNFSTGGNDAIISELQKQFNTAQTTTSPLVLDLDGDGVVESTTLSKSLSSGTHFNLDAKGLSENTGWVNTDDGLLVRDLNADGKITSGRELFGNHTLLANGQEATNGFLALKDLDSNADGVINTQDTAFASLNIWKDANGDGLTDAGELLTLAQAGVASLNVAYTTGNTTDTQGNQHLQLGGYTTTTGSTRKMDDVWFATDSARTQDQEQPIAISTTIAALPNIAGMGNVRSLQQAA